MNAMIMIALLGLFINGFIGIVDHGFGGIVTGGVRPFTEDSIVANAQNANNNSTSTSYASQLPFGNWVSGADSMTKWTDFFTFGYLIKGMALIAGFSHMDPTTYTIFSGMIIATGVIIGATTLWYMITGRGSQGHI